MPGRLSLEVQNTWDVEGMTDLVKKRKVIQPTSFTTPSRPVHVDRYSLTDSIIKDHVGEWRYIPPELRRMGELRNPLICDHERKRMTTATMRWRCMDCGMEL